MNRRHLLLSLVAAASAAACSGPYYVAADVSSFGQWPQAKIGASYAFERLPSQQESARQGELENSARAALEKAGFKPAADLKSADIVVTLGSRISAQDRAPWDDPLWGRWYGGVGYWRYGGLWRNHPNLLDRRFDREVALLLRDRQSNEPLYEARASNDGATMGDNSLMAALFLAALSDFPQARPESHQVTVQATR